MKNVFLSLVQAADDDPVTAFLTRDWAALGGWSLFIGVGLLIVVGAFKEWWVPGKRYARLEASADKLLTANSLLTTQNGQLIVANEITTHFFQETVPKRGVAPHDETQLVD